MVKPEQVNDHVAISHTIQEVARAFDQKKHEELLPQLFVENAPIIYWLRKQKLDFTLPGGIAGFKECHDRCYWTQHLVSPQVLSIDGDRAEARSPVHALHLQVRDDGSHNHWVIGAVYEDKLIRDGSKWLIESRKALCPWVEGDFLVGGVKMYPEMVDLEETL